MEITSQPSYLLNSENASPFGTLSVYLSYADMAAAVNSATNTVTLAIANLLFAFIADSSCVRYIQVLP
jgi:hypothetical protein